MENRSFSGAPNVFFPRQGQSFLGLILLIGGIVAVVSFFIAFLATSFVDTGYGYAASLSAEAAAISGAQDGMLRLDRNSGFYTTSGGYTLSVGSSTATVTVTQNTPSVGFVTMLSAATVSGRTKKINVVLSENASTSQVNVVSWTETQ